MALDAQLLTEAGLNQQPRGKLHTHPPTPSPQQAELNSAKIKGLFIQEAHTPSRLRGFSLRRPFHP